MELEVKNLSLIDYNKLLEIAKKYSKDSDYISIRGVYYDISRNGETRIFINSKNDYKKVIFEYAEKYSEIYIKKIEENELLLNKLNVIKSKWWYKLFSKKDE